MSALGVGLVGCGTISAVYLRNGAAARRGAVRRVRRRRPGGGGARRPRARARGVHARRSCCAHPDVDVVLCLTPPDWHAEIALRAIAAGKHVYTEKPLATSVERRRARVLDAAAAARSAGRLRARHVPRRGHPDAARGDRRRGDRHARAGAGAAAGRSARALAPSPAFLYAELAGPLLDIGPYAVATAVELLGPVRRVTALATRPREEGVIETGPRAGTRFPIVGADAGQRGARARGGVLTTLTPRSTPTVRRGTASSIHGSDGTLLGGDPNTFDGPVDPAPPQRGGRGADARARAGQRAGLGLDDLCRAVAATEPRAAARWRARSRCSPRCGPRAEGSAVAIEPPPGRAAGRTSDSAAGLAQAALDVAEVELALGTAAST